MVGKQTKSLCAAYAPTTKIAELFESSLIKWDENCRPVVPKPSRMLVTESGGEGNRKTKLLWIGCAPNTNL